MRFGPPRLPIHGQCRSSRICSGRRPGAIAAITLVARAHSWRARRHRNDFKPRLPRNRHDD